MPFSPKDLEQAGYLRNRLEKRDRHLGRQARRAGSDCYRVYDRDIPEIPLAIDRYGGSAVAYLYERPFEKPDDEEAAWLGLMAETTAEALGMPRAEVFTKTRRRLGVSEQYGSDEREANGERIVAEQGLSFIVNLGGHIDTGLFMDHRRARAMIRGNSAGKRVLNLFCYTGSFSVYALAGGASKVVGVDLSNTYLAWAERNLALNRLDDRRYAGIRADAIAWLADAAANGELYDIIVLDPPTFSNSKMMAGFLDVQRQWAALVAACLGVLSSGGFILFSSNARSIKVDPESLVDAKIIEVSDFTIPDDFRGRPHRSWIVSRDDLNPTMFFRHGQA